MMITMMIVAAIYAYKVKGNVCSKGINMIGMALAMGFVLDGIILVNVLT